MSFRYRKRHNNKHVKPLKIMKKKNYFQPTMKFHQLKTASFIAESFEVTAKPQENPQEEDGMQGFTVHDGWN